jgi:pimeloyl-ACP methyl ester carboxylesterase
MNIHSADGRPDETSRNQELRRNRQTKQARGFRASRVACAAMAIEFADVASGVRLAYERLGEPSAPPVMLMMGIGAQLIAWPDGLCDALVARGLQLVRFDNRDAGLSTHIVNAPAPNLPAALAGDYSSASYTLSDMAHDVVGLCDALGFASVHVVGASMGGFVAQTVAIEYPQRVRSLTSIMATTGDPKVGQAHADLLREFAKAGGGPAATRDAVVQRNVEIFRIVGSPGFPTDEHAVAERAGRAFDRAFDPIGMARQAVAVVASGDRTAKLRDVRVPALVIHGADDKMCDVSGGRATAAAIPGAELIVIDGMGHDLPAPLWRRLADAISDHVLRAS